MSLEILHRLAQRGSIRWLSYYFAEFIAGQAGDAADPWLLYSAALVSEAHQNGDVCVDLDRFVDTALFAADDDNLPSPRGIDLADWRQRLLDAPCVGQAGDTMPLIVDRDRLYLYRYWRYESRVAEHIKALLDRAPADDGADAEVELADLDLDQAEAVTRATRQCLGVISGGPGSGKTSSVVRVLDALLRREPGLRIALTAPTGKAAARLQESIAERLPAADGSLPAGMPRQATTLHRLLGARGNRFLHDADRPLAVDCVIVDEASMIDLKLMFQLFEALPDDARLILLGDRDQLASVAAGNVLGDITGHGQRLDRDAPPIARAISLLSGTYRFGGDSAIARLAGCINSGDDAAVIELLRSPSDQLTWYDHEEPATSGALLQRIVEAYQPIFTAGGPLEALAIFDSIRVLCVTNGGPQGVDRLNADITAMLAERHGQGSGSIEHGQPILVTRNHHALELYNGDTGILWRIDGVLYACFQSESGGLRRFVVQRLSGYEPAWAVTVHKAQGSEYDTVLLLLGSDASAEGLSRELFYTAVTRARTNFVLHGGVELVKRAVTGKTRRYSGLADRLGWPA